VEGEDDCLIVIVAAAVFLDFALDSLIVIFVSKEVIVWFVFGRVDDFVANVSFVNGRFLSVHESFMMFVLKLLNNCVF